MTEQHIFLDGNIIPLHEACLRPDDLGPLRAYAVYEGIAGINGEPFHFTEHYERLVCSAERIGLNIPIDHDTLRAGIVELLKKNELTDTRADIRLVVSGGVGDHGIIYTPSNERVWALTERATPKGDEYTHGATLITHEHQRPLASAKTTEYALAVSLQKKRIDAGAIEILYHANGEVREGATSNIFAIKDSVLITPGEHVLIGITRTLVLECARELGISTEERALTMEELLHADEVFITSSFRDIVPIVRIDDTAIGNGALRDITQNLMDTFTQKL